MRKINCIALFLLIICMLCSSAYAQEDDRVELDASGLRAGDPLQFKVRIDSLEQLSFAEARARLTAILCPYGSDSGSCEIMSLAPSTEDSASIDAVFSVGQLPVSGDYTLDVSFLDETGVFATTTASFVLRGVQEAADADETGTAEMTEEPEISETPAAEPAAETETVSDIPGENVSGDAVTEIPELTETAEPVEETAAVTDTPAEPLPVTKAILRPEIRDGAGTQMIYGSTVYVNDAYTLQMTFDRPLNDSVILEAGLPAGLLSAPIDPASECMLYLNADGTAWEFPGGLWAGGSYSCGLRFSDSAWIAAQPVTFSLKQAPDPVPGIEETFEMDRLSWTNYPVNVTKHPATHQMVVSDSRGNLICSDNAACARFNAEDVYIMTYQVPAAWGAVLPSGLDLTATVTWPEFWASALADSPDRVLAEEFGQACSVDWEGNSTLTLQETSPGRYSASCTFVPSGLSNPVQAAAKVHLNDNSFAVNDLSVWMPANIIKSEAVLTPELTLRMRENAPEVEQIRGGTIGTLYRTSRDYPNTFDGAGAPALYKLKAEISGISSVREPQFGDQVVVSWPLLDTLALTGDMPSCLVPTNGGYALGTLMRTENGIWTAECEFRFPRTMDITANGTQMEMQLRSGVYQTSARVQMSGAPFKMETLYVDLDVPVHMFLGQPTDFHIRLSDSTGGFSEYTSAVLEAEGVTLTDSWIYNYLTTCGGSYAVGIDGTSECSVYFTDPVTEPSEMHFDLITSGAGTLFDVVFRPSADITVQPITNIEAYLTVKLYHAGEEVALPASDDAAFMVGDDYQLKFYLTPAPAFSDVVNAVAVGYDGMVLDWFEPLLIRWDAIPGGMTGLNFYRDGGSFVASYDFSFSQGNLYLDGNMGRLVVEPSISGWDIEVMNGYEPIKLPSRIDRRPLSLEITDFTVPGSSAPDHDLFVGQEAEFEIKFDGSMDAFDPLQLMVGYDANGIHTPLSCAPDYQNGVLRCSITAQCMDYSTGSNYPDVCGTNLSLYAVYNGDPVNQAAEAQEKVFNVKRYALRLTPVTDSSISAKDVRFVQSVNADLQSMQVGTLSIGGWNVDSYIPREIRTRTNQEYLSYPVVFRYELPAGMAIDENAVRLDVAITSGSRANPLEETISLRPRSVSSDTVMFELDFGSYELMDDGRIVKDVLENAVEIRSLTARYIGDPQISEASAVFESPDLNFALKVATVLETNLDLSFPGIMSFGGVLALESLMQPFDIHCSQLYQDMGCSLDAPEQVMVLPTPQPPAADPFFTENTESENAETDGMIPFEVTEAIPAEGSMALNFEDQGCWGKLKTPVSGQPQIYVNGAAAPICYLTAWNENRQIWIATNGDL